MTGTVIKGTVRRAAALAGATTVLLVTSALLAGPASAEVPVGWGTQEPVDKLFVLGVMVGVPVLLFVLIIAAVYLPSVARGERVAPGATGPQDQWLGGRRNAGEIASSPTTTASGGVLTGADAQTTDGGASARW
ncbi:hypothetical protein [Nocardioides sp.]|uniref:hypothetical protein n=1 Tax=Nocardioides sp. TaxID=35761 RepID=UPI0027274327|nr:hypothetical protein [Nocardioides sp.]MDO9457130.1 hypothetical protein [Nocardioides sp.]